MEKILLVILLVSSIPGTVFARSATTEASQSITAETSEISPSEKLINLVYYPHRTHFLMGGYLQSSATSKSTVSDDSGDLTDSVLTFTRIGANVEYGITNHLRVGVAMNQLVQQDNVSVSDTDGTANDHVSLGISDPEFNVAYRTYENTRLGLFSDIILTTQTSFGPQVVSTGAQTGNNKLGYWSEQITLPVYWLYASHEFEFAPGFTRNFGTLISGATDKTTGSDDTYWSWNLLFRDRIHITDVFFLQPTVTVDLRDGYDFNSHAGTSRHIEIPVRVFPEISLGYVITPWCLLELTVAYQSYEERTTLPTEVTRKDDIAETNFAIRTNFTF